MLGALAGNRGPKADHHGGCAEISCGNQVLNEGKSLDGSTMRAMEVGGGVNGKPTGAPKPACDSCSDIGNYFNISEIKSE